MADEAPETPETTETVETEETKEKKEGWKPGPWLLGACLGTAFIGGLFYYLARVNGCNSIDVNVDGNLNHGGKVEVPVSGTLEVEHTIDTATFEKVCKDCGQQPPKKPGKKSNNTRRNSQSGGARIYNNNGSGNQTITEQPAGQPTGQGSAGGQNVNLQGGSGDGITIINNNGDGSQSVNTSGGNGITIINNNGDGNRQQTVDTVTQRGRKGVPVTTTWTVGYMTSAGPCNPCRGRVRGN